MPSHCRRVTAVKCEYMQGIPFVQLKHRFSVLLYNHRVPLDGDQNAPRQEDEHRCYQSDENHACFAFELNAVERAYEIDRAKNSPDKSGSLLKVDCQFKILLYQMKSIK